MRQTSLFLIKLRNILHFIHYPFPRSGEKHPQTSGWQFFPILGLLLFAPMAHADPLPSDRRIDWSHAGIPGGVPSNYTLFCNVLQIPGTNIVADPTGATDSTVAIQTAINLAPNNSVVMIPSGTYNCSGQLNIKDKQIILRGLQGHTWITNTSASGSAIKIYASSYTANWSGLNSIAGGATNGSFCFTFLTNSPWANGAPSLMTNVWYYVGSQTDPPDVIRDGCNDNANYLHQNMQIIQITNIVNGTNIYFTPPLRWDLSAGNPYVSIVSTLGNANNCGIENLNLTFSVEHAGANALVYFSQVQQCWVTGCHLYKTCNNAIIFNSASQCYAANNVIDHAWDYVGGWGYGIWLFDCANDILMENNIFFNMRHGLATEGWVTGCVFAYNYMTNECFPVNHRHPGQFNVRRYHHARGRRKIQSHRRQHD